MALSKEEFELFQAHLRQTCKPPLKCPMCGTNEWSISGPVVLLQYSVELEAAYATGPGGAPVVIMTCLHCYFVRQFAWLPILK
jgi:hypothetical protein